MQDRFKFRIAVFERYNTEEWEFIKFIENSDKVGVSTSGNVIQANVQGLIIHLSREKTPENVYRTMEAVQCTGLKDKNGTLIYEGDVVKSEAQAGIIINYGIVGFNEKEAKFLITENLQSKDYRLSFWYRDSLEVIGNIYENKELLNG